MRAPAARLLVMALSVLIPGWATSGEEPTAPAPAPAEAKRLFVDPTTEPWQPVEGVPGAEWKPLRSDAKTGAVTALVRFPAGHVEPAHHHTHGHTVIVVSGAKEVENVTRGESYRMAEGDLLYTPATEVHRVRYLTRCTFLFITDGPFDLFWDEEP